jgi:hypothetical protein
MPTASPVRHRAGPGPIEVRLASAALLQHNRRHGSGSAGIHGIVVSYRPEKQRLVRPPRATHIEPVIRGSKATMKTTWICLVAATACVGLWSHAAGAITSKQSTATYKAADLCTKQATEKFPDHSGDGLKKRDAWLRQCLINAGLPARSSLPPRDK